MACYSFGYLITPLLIKVNFYERFGRRGTAQFALLLLSAALFLYSLAYFIPDQYCLLYVFVSVITRILEGLGMGGSVAAIMSLISKIFPDSRGVALSARGVGVSLGVCLGQLSEPPFSIQQATLAPSFSLSVLTFLTIFYLLVFLENRERTNPDQLS